MIIPKLSQKRIKWLLYDWSPYKLDKFVCGLQFYFRYIDPRKLHLERPAAGILVTGSAVHLALELFFSPRMKRGYKSPESFFSVFKSIWHAAINGETWRDRQWSWSKAYFKSEQEKWSLYHFARLILYNFYWKNISYFWDSSLIRPQVEKELIDPYFGPQGNYTLRRKVDRFQIWPNENGKLCVYFIDYKLGTGQRQEMLRGRDWAHIIETWIYMTLEQSFEYPYLLGGSCIYPLGDYSNPNLFIGDLEILGVKVKIDDIQSLTKSELKTLEMPSDAQFNALKDVIVNAKEKLESALCDEKFVPQPGDHCEICQFRPDCKEILEKWNGRTPVSFSKRATVPADFVPSSRQEGSQMRLKLKPSGMRRKKKLPES